MSSSERPPAMAAESGPRPPASPSPPAAARTRTVVITALIAGLALLAGVLLGPWAHDQFARLQAAQQERAAGDTWYISQMHPWIIQPEPGQCPICGMDLTPVDPTRFAGEISIDPVVVQNMGVRIERADRGPIIRQIRTAGTVEWDQTRISDVQLRFGGWVETVHVDALYDRVAVGDPLLTIYSPTIYSAAQEYAQALAATPASSMEDTLVQAARRRLQLAGVPPSELERLRGGGAAREAITITAPADGLVIVKNVNAGTQVAPQTLVYRIADPDQVWVEAVLHEEQLPFVAAGQSALVIDRHGGIERLSATIDSVYPVVDARTREARARLVVDNSGGRLRPGSYVTVLIDQRLPGEHVRIPQMAVIGTGEREVVFVSRGRGRFEARQVVVGPGDGAGLVAIDEGIEAGEAVVISGQFLLDSESKMREALVKVMQGDLASEQAPAASEGDELTELPAVVQEPWAVLVRRYLAVQEAYYQQRPAGEAVAALRRATEDFLAAGRTADDHFEHHVAAVVDLQEAVAGLDGDNGKAAFGSFSIALDRLAKAVGQPAGFERPLVGMRCGMATGIPDKGVWLQAGGDVRNPYYGADSGMHACAADSWGLPMQDGDAPSAATAAPQQDQRPATMDGHSHSQGATETEPGKATASAASETPEQNTSAETGPPEPAIIDAYLASARAAYQDDLAGMQENLKALTDAEDAEIAQAARDLQAATDLQGARRALGRLGVSLRDRLRRGGGNLGGDLRVLRCGMYSDAPEDGLWLQRTAGDPRNPFYGKEAGMSACAMDVWQVTAEGLREIEP